MLFQVRRLRVVPHGSNRHRRHHRVHDAPVPDRRLPPLRPLPLGPAGLHPVVTAAQAALLHLQVADFLALRRDGQRGIIDQGVRRAVQVHNKVNSFDEGICPKKDNLRNCFHNLNFGI